MDFNRAAEAIEFDYQTNKHCLDKMMTLDMELTSTHKLMYKMEYNPLLRMGKVTFKAPTTGTLFAYLTNILQLLTRSLGDTVTHKRWYGHKDGDEKSFLRVFFAGGINMVVEADRFLDIKLLKGD